MENMTNDSKQNKSELSDNLFDLLFPPMSDLEEAVPYSQSVYKELENQNAVQFAAKKAYAEGFVAGLAKAEAIMTIARKMRLNGMTPDAISSLTGLPADVVRNL